VNVASVEREGGEKKKKELAKERKAQNDPYCFILVGERGREEKKKECL